MCDMWRHDLFVSSKACCQGSVKSDVVSYMDDSIFLLQICLTCPSYNGRRPQMSSLRGHLYPPSTCSTTHAIPFVLPYYVSLMLHLPSLTIFFFFFFFTDTGDRPYKCQFCGDQFARRFAAVFISYFGSNTPLTCLSCLLVTFYLDTSINVTQTKNHYLLVRAFVVKKDRSQLLERLLQNKYAISVSKQTLLAMDVIHVVSSFFLCFLFLFNNNIKKSFSKMRSS